MTTTELGATATDELVELLAHPTDDEVAALDAWWRANNYLTVGQIYLMANPLLREPLTRRAHQAAAARVTGAPARGCRSSTRTSPG